MNDIDVAPLRETRSFDRRPQLDIHADLDRPHPVHLHSPDPAAEHPQEDVESSEPTTVDGDAAAFSSGRHTPLRAFVRVDRLQNEWRCVIVR
jgi:hypothetical protein